MNLHPSRRVDDVSPNITPLVDVVFLLLIFFMVSTTFDHSSEINIVLPEASEEMLTTQVNALRVLIGPQGEVYINREPVEEPSLQTIQEALSRAAGALVDAPDAVPGAQADITGPSVIISADVETSHRSVIQVMDAARNIGLLKITFAVKRIPAPQAATPPSG